MERYRVGLSPAISQVVSDALPGQAAGRPVSERGDPSRELEPLATPSGGMTPAKNPPGNRGDGPATKARDSSANSGIVAALGAVLAIATRSSARQLVVGRQWQLTRDPGLEIEAAISPDGKFLAYVVNDSGGVRIRVRQVEGGGEPVIIDPVRNNFQTSPHWSPDGNRLLFAPGRGIEVLIPPLGGQFGP